MVNTQNLDLGEINVDLILNENWQKIDEKAINKNGTVPFIAEQIGIDPISEQGLATKHYVDTSTLKLGETEVTAYRGDRGKIAYDHSQTIGNPHNVAKADVGLGNVQNVDTTTTENISDSLNKRFLTDVEKALLDNTSGVNTGDETGESIKTKLGTDFTDLVKRDGTVPFVAPQKGVTPVEDGDLVTKKFVTDLISSVSQPSYIPYSVNSGAVDSNGCANFIGKIDNASIRLFATTTPIVLTYANGKQEVISADYAIGQINSDGNYSVVKEYASNPVVTKAIITESLVAPSSPSNGDYWLNISVKPYQPFKRVAGAWVATQFVKLGEFVRTSGVIGTIASAAFNGKYDSGYFPVVISNTYNKNHNLCTKDFRYKVFIADDLNGTNQRSVDYFVISLALGGCGYVDGVTTSTMLSIMTASGQIALSTSYTYLSTGYFKVIAERNF